MRPESRGTAPHSLGSSFVASPPLLRRTPERVIGEILDSYSNCVMSSFAQLRESITNRPLFVMMEPLLQCDPVHDHEAPKDVLPLFQAYIDKAESQVLNVPTTCLRIKLEEALVTLMKEANDLNATLNDRLDRTESLLADSQAQLLAQKDVMINVLKKKSDEKLKQLTEIQTLKEQLHQRKAHSGVELYRPDFGFDGTKRGLGEEGDELREQWLIKLREKDVEIARLQKDLQNAKTELDLAKTLGKASLDEAEQNRLAALSKNNQALSLEDQNRLLRARLDELEKSVGLDSTAQKKLIDQLKAEVSELTRKRAISDEALSTANQRLDEYNRKVVFLEEQLATEKQKRANNEDTLRKELERTTMELMKTKDELRRQALEADRLSALLELKQRESEGDDILASMSDELERLKKENSRLTSDLKVYHSKLANATARLMRASDNHSALQSRQTIREVSELFDTSDLQHIAHELGTDVDVSDLPFDQEGLSGNEISALDAAGERSPSPKPSQLLINKYREIISVLAAIDEPNIPRTVAGLNKFLLAAIKNRSSGTGFSEFLEKGGAGQQEKGSGVRKGKKSVRSSPYPQPEASESSKAGSTGRRSNLVKKPVANDDLARLLARDDVDEYISQRIQEGIDAFQEAYTAGTGAHILQNIRDTAVSRLDQISHRSCQTILSYVGESMRTLSNSEIIDETKGKFQDPEGRWRAISHGNLPETAEPTSRSANEERLALYNKTSDCNLPFSDPNHPIYSRDAGVVANIAGPTLGLHSPNSKRLHKDTPDKLTTDDLITHIDNEVQLSTNYAKQKAEAYKAYARRYKGVGCNALSFTQQIAQLDSAKGFMNSLVIRSAAPTESASITTPKSISRTRNPKRSPELSVQEHSSTPQTLPRSVHSVSNIHGLSVSSLQQEVSEQQTRTSKPIIVQNSTTKLDRKVPRALASPSPMDLPPINPGPSSVEPSSCLDSTLHITTTGTEINARANIQEATFVDSRPMTPRTISTAIQLIDGTEADGIYIRMTKDGIINGQIVVKDGAIISLSYRVAEMARINRVMYCTVVPNKERSHASPVSTPVAEQPSSLPIALAKNMAPPEAVVSPALDEFVSSKQNDIPDHSNVVSANLSIVTIMEATHDSLLGGDNPRIRGTVNGPDLGPRDSVFSKHFSLSIITDKVESSEADAVPSQEKVIDDLTIAENLAEETPQHTRVADQTRTDQSLHSADGIFMGVSAIELQRSSVLDGSFSGSHSPSQLTLSTECLDDAVMNALSSLPSSECPTAEPRKVRMSQRELELTEPGAVLQTIRIHDTTGTDRTIEVVTRVTDTPYPYTSSQEAHRPLPQTLPRVEAKEFVYDLGAMKHATLEGASLRNTTTGNEILEKALSVKTIARVGGFHEHPQHTFGTAVSRASRQIPVDDSAVIRLYRKPPGAAPSPTVVILNQLAGLNSPEVESPTHVSFSSCFEPTRSNSVTREVRTEAPLVDIVAPDPPIEVIKQPREPTLSKPKYYTTTKGVRNTPTDTSK
ncbi:hypothetical protein GMRT_12269 [Giardia muris]|uniref:Coiled-coil protein n=1 Tax=Giardia muris TaxID=5742 RepID=A0A4Z1T0S3_GIAMU|nr:hypothetical protein GMRT_12269 [Giardia muris]|eukprot:TNJ30575.1 hypothetical protein GMRT_12269 [Giardia muris]